MSASIVSHKALVTDWSLFRTSHRSAVTASVSTRRYHDRRRVLLLAFLLLVASFGCSSSEGEGERFRDARRSDLENRVFTFADGRPFADALNNTTTTLTFGNFANDGDGNANTGPFMLTAAAGTSAGTVLLASCNLRIETSSFAVTAFPELQPGLIVPLDPCLISLEDGRFSVQNADTGAMATATTSTSTTTSGVAFVLTADFFDNIGSYSVIDVATQSVFSDIALGGVHSDALARVFDGQIYVVNRFGVDSIQRIDPDAGFMTPAGAELSAGNGTNPQDIVVVAPTKAYVSRLQSSELLIINPRTLTGRGRIDLSALAKPEDLDGFPEASRMLVHDGLVYLLLQHLDFSAGVIPLQVAPGEVVIIDPETDAIMTVIALNQTNPFSDLIFSSDLNRLLVSSVGGFGVTDGGIEALDPTTRTVDAGFIVSETTMGGDITHFGLVSATKGYALVTDAAFMVSLVSFNPTTGQRLRTVAGPFDIFVPHFAINSRGELYLAVADSTALTPEVVVFDTQTDAEIGRVPSGALPPVFIVFVEE